MPISMSRWQWRPLSPLFYGVGEQPKATATFHSSPYRCAIQMNSPPNPWNLEVSLMPCSRENGTLIPETGRRGAFTPEKHRCMARCRRSADVGTLWNVAVDEEFWKVPTDWCFSTSCNSCLPCPDGYIMLSSCLPMVGCSSSANTNPEDVLSLRIQNI